MLERTYSPNVITSLDGHVALQLHTLDDIGPVRDRSGAGVYFSWRGQRGATSGRLVVHFSDTIGQVDLSKFGLINVADKAQTLVWLAEAAVGDHLNEEGTLAPLQQGEPPLLIPCYSYRLEDWRSRPPGSDERVAHYLRGRLRAAWDYDQHYVTVGTPDLLRLRVTLTRLQKLATLGERKGLWQEVGDATLESILLTPLAAISEEEGVRPGSARDGGASLLALLVGARFAGAREHWERAINSHGGPSEIPARTASEAMSMLESVGRIVAGRHNDTLGNLIKHFKATGTLNSALARSLEALWGFANTSPGVRHGGAQPSNITRAEASFVLHTCESAALLFLSMET